MPLLLSLLDHVDDDALRLILLYAGPVASGTLGKVSVHWRDRILENNNLVWKHFCQQRWGSAVVSSSSSSSSSLPPLPPKWYEYYRHRSSSWKIIGNNESSSLNLIQEEYAHDPYQLLSACILASRTSGGYIVRKTVRDFLTKYQTPTQVLTTGDLEIMGKELRPLGMNRERTIQKFAAGFVKPWNCVTELHGCGAFCKSSHALFCHGDWKGVLRNKKADRNVRAYAAFCKRNNATSSSTDAACGKESKEEEESWESKPSKRKRAPQKTVTTKRRMPARGARRSLCQQRK